MVVVLVVVTMTLPLVPAGRVSTGFLPPSSRTRPVRPVDLARPVSKINVLMFATVVAASPANTAASAGEGEGLDDVKERLEGTGRKRSDVGVRSDMLLIEDVVGCGE